jgi:hypothetical protein
MLKAIRYFVCCVALLAVVGFFTPVPAARADGQDYNAYWQEQTETPQQEQTELQQKEQDYNAYWKEAAEQQQQPPPAQV